MPVTSPHMTILTTPLESGTTAKPSWVYSRAFAVLRCGSPNCVTNCFTVIPATTFPTRTLGSISEGSPGCAETTWLDLSEQAVRKTSTASVEATFDHDMIFSFITGTRNSRQTESRRVRAPGLQPRENCPPVGRVPSPGVDPTACPSVSRP